MHLNKLERSKVLSVVADFVFQNSLQAGFLQFLNSVVDICWNNCIWFEIVKLKCLPQLLEF